MECFESLLYKFRIKANVVTQVLIYIRIDMRFCTYLYICTSLLPTNYTTIFVHQLAAVDEIFW